LLRLLLQTVDGAFPYLTPHLLQKCFPAEKVQDILWIGISVRDTCIVPVLKIPKDGAATAPKPRGYTFSDQVQLDPWLAPYTRITVPTFDPVADAIQFSPKQVADTSTLITASKQHTMVWTDNGRQQLSTGVYQAAAAGLKSHVNVPLFDVTLTDATEKRRRAAYQRTQAWCSEMIHYSSQQLQSQKQGRIWASCLIAPKEHSLFEDPDVEQQYNAIKKQLQEDQPQVTGVVFVGWQYAKTPAQKLALLQTSADRFKKQAAAANLVSNPILAVLATNTLSQLLGCYQIGIHVVGTNLPSKWAKTHRAFVVDFSSWESSLQQATATKRPRLAEPDIKESNVLLLDADGCTPVVVASKSDAPSWIRDNRPILPGCSCMTCSQHNRAYLYHLVKTKELLVEILLFIHNLHHLLGMCRELQDAHKEGTQEDFYKFIMSQLQQ